MNIKGYDITMKNAWAYIQGNTRKIMNTLGPEILKSPQHIQEQILWRDVIHNPLCSKKGQCMLPLDNPCKCELPDKLYSDKSCEGGCYPAIMDKFTWYRFKQLCARRNVDIYNDKFDWDVIMSDINTVEQTLFSSLLGSNKSIQTRGKVEINKTFTGQFKLFNPHETNLVINSISPSCNCCEVKQIKPIQPNSYGDLVYSIDTTGKIGGDHDIWITLRYNEINRISLLIKFTL